MSLGDLAELVLGPADSLFLDFDGTLTELGLDPDAIRLDGATDAALGRVASRLGGAVVVISGRDLRDLAARTPSTVWRAGGHGLEVVPPGGTLPVAPGPPDAAILAPLHAVAKRPGVRLELKGPVAALHFRAAPDAEDACLAAAQEAAAARPGYVHQAGKMVVEVKPETAHKGSALQRLAGRPPFVGRRPVMLGDDTTDEDAILAAQAMGGLGIKVGPGASAARLRAPDPQAVRLWIAREAGRP